MSTSLASSFFLSKYFFQPQVRCGKAHMEHCILPEVHVMQLCCSVISYSGRLWNNESLTAALSCQVLLPVPCLSSDLLCAFWILSDWEALEQCAATENCAFGLILYEIIVSLIHSCILETSFLIYYLKLSFLLAACTVTISHCLLVQLNSSLASPEL